MKILTSKKQDELLGLIFGLQKSIEQNDFIEATDLLSEIATRVLNLDRLVAIKRLLDLDKEIEIK